MGHVAARGCRHHRLGAGRPDRRRSTRRAPTWSRWSSRGSSAGGQLMLTTMVENFPGFRDGIMGPELMSEMRAQAQRFGAEIDRGRGRRRSTCRRGRSASTSPATRSPDAGALIVATGASARLLGPAVRTRADGTRRVDLRHLRRLLLPGRPIAVVGGGDSALEEAIFLTKFASKVTRHPPARQAARVEDHAGQGPREPEDRVRLEQRGHRGARTPAKGRGHRARACATCRPAR